MRLPLSTLALGTCFLGVAAVFAQTWLQVDSGVLQLKQPSWSLPIPVKPSVTVPGVEAVSGTQIGLYMATIDRPLFAPDRRAPPPPDLVTQVPPPDPLAGVQLLGLLTGELWTGAILSQDGKTRRVELGQSVAGWTLTTIDQRNATFSRNGEVRVLVLVRQKAPVAVAPRVSVAPVVGGSSAPAADIEDENRARMIRLQRLLQQQNR